MKKLLCTIGLIVLLAVSAQACNIPVFRYALERWRPDVSEFYVFHQGKLDTVAQGQVEQLQRRAGNGGANATVKLVDLEASPNAPELAWWEGLKASAASPTLPYLLVRLPHPRGPVNAWHGRLDEGLHSALVDSPVRTELSKRLLNGDSIVWLMVRSGDRVRDQKVRDLVLEQCQSLSSRIELPEGIGLPGSELFSDVPLFLKFSLLEIDRNDEHEQFLLQLFASFQPESFREHEPLLIPVFGRGRALEVIPADGVDERLIGDLTAFLCGACSCQVKEQNPGFDLLLSANWDRELFGEDAHLPPPAKENGEGNRAPVLLTIPPGK